MLPQIESVTTYSETFSKSIVRVSCLCSSKQISSDTSLALRFGLLYAISVRIGVKGKNFVKPLTCRG
jgi:hypothetical protein